MRRKPQHKLLAAGAITAIFAAVIMMASQFMPTLSIRALSSPTIDPLPNTRTRPQLLTFGMYVTPDPNQNPIDPPERFTGYHTALDIEVAEDEKDKVIPVHAVCAGEIVRSGFASGYGGHIVQRCVLNGQDVTVIYGHLSSRELTPIREMVQTGQRIGILAPEYSGSSGQTRKHLHLGIHKGTDIDIRGYVQTEAQLENFIDPKEALGL